MSAANDTMLEVAVNAAASGHDPGGFEPVTDADGRPNGYQAVFRETSPKRGLTTGSRQFEGAITQRPVVCHT
jgi:hypothetical protein